MADDKDCARAVVKSEKQDAGIPFENDGNFLQHYLNSQKNEKKPEIICLNIKQEPKKKIGPPIKKSRFTIMFNQMKRTKAAAAASAKKTSECFHHEDSSSSDDEKMSHSKPEVTKASANNAGSIRRGLYTQATLQSSAILPVTSLKVESNTDLQGTSSQVKVKRKKSRWGEKVDLTEVAPPGITNLTGMPTVPIPTMIPKLGVPNAYRPVGLVGCTELSDEQIKQLEEQREMQAMYNLILASRNTQKVATMPTHVGNKKKKYDYDSDEEIDEELGTWEHQNRRFEMQKTRELAEKLTTKSDGKHFIGDFLPPDELERFMETFKALKEGRTPDFSDYRDFKIKCDNIGFKMLEKMGWNEGDGLGSEKSGITAPVNQGKQSIDGRGVGVDKPEGLTKDDDEFSAYRKRMMLAYRFRPNPLNNPRRPYY